MRSINYIQHMEMIITGRLVGEEEEEVVGVSPNRGAGGDGAGVADYRRVRELKPLPRPQPAVGGTLAFSSKEGEEELQPPESKQ